MKPNLLPLVLAAGLAAMSLAQAQPSPARERYERQLSFCNTGNLSGPERQGCIRAAGREFDNAGGGAPSETPRTTQDGRATVVTPEGARLPASGDTPTPTSDGRALVVPPADRSATPR